LHDPAGTERAAGLPRKPGDGGRRFLIPREALPPGFEARLERPSSEAVPARPAATVVLAREVGREPEVLLLRRPARSSFAAGAWVFPGGAVDAQDREVGLSAPADGADAASWARRLGLEDPAEAVAFVVAALREAWEETGILLAEGVDPASLPAARRSALAGEPSLGALLRRAGGRLSTRRLLYLAHWITPTAEPRRYDTRFFLARVPEGAECELRGAELEESRWMAPAAAAEAYEIGDLHLLPPTVHTLRRLARYPSLDDAWHDLRGAPVPTILPRMRMAAEGAVIEF
jgi:8-oxo-dGTP pyrophosphatase MutT (NUDIX family)